MNIFQGIIKSGLDRFTDLKYLFLRALIEFQADDLD